MLLAYLLLLAHDPADPPSTYSGRAGKLDVRVPRLEAAAEMDGKARRERVVPTAIHFGIRAFEAHGVVHATLADRDRIAADDHVQILLSTFNDGRQATVFAVNPYGVQSDGALVETGATSGNGFNNAVVKRETADLSPDFVFESKGRLTEQGYEVEVRIPFKSLRYPGTVLFAGYGSTLRDPSELGRAELRRAEDGFFLKLSYLFQM